MTAENGDLLSHRVAEYHWYLPVNSGVKNAALPVYFTPPSFFF